MSACWVIPLLLLLPARDEEATRPRERHRLLFYNVENLFDTRDDPDTRDEEFTPEGNQHWTVERYKRKIRQLSTTIVAAGEGTLPLLVGLAEVENRRVLLDLITRSVLSDGNYGLLHADSPDPRGIDVALLYRKEHFQVLKAAHLPVYLDETTTTRDILYCKGLLQRADTLHLFVCHFPSMVNGERGSEWKRRRAAGVLRRAIDTIQQANESAAIVIMGDLNGKVNTRAQRDLRVTYPDDRPIDPATLYYTTDRPRGATRGSYRFRGQWQTIDHVIVSGALLNGGHAWQAAPRAGLFMDDFLLEEDKPRYGKRPLPTYRGPVYMGGCSDHLPIYLDIFPVPEEQEQR
ncbi:MAG: endonuclease [Odoribacteraceae bacterium]|nr:endonuclease [Odoribacteraceae bacterium]